MSIFNANLPSMNYGRAWFAATTHGRRIFVLGGQISGNRPKAIGEMFDIDTQRWTKIYSKSAARRCCTAVMLGDNIIVMDNRAAEQYNVVSKQWSPFPLMNTRRVGFAAAVLDGKIIVVGGYDGSSFVSVEEYDPSTGEWREITPMHCKRACCATAVLDGKLYVMGGYDGDNNLSSAEVYDPTTQQWDLLSDMTTPRVSFGAVPLEGRIVVAGGGGSGYLNLLSSCEAYDPQTQKWSHIGSMHTKRAGCAAVEVERNIYVLGGKDENHNELSSMEYLPLSAFFAFLLNDKPVLAKELDIDDNAMPAFLSFIGHNCKMLTLWKVLRNRQDLLTVE